MKNKLTFIKLDFSINPIYYIKNFIESSNKKVIFISANRRPIWFLEKILKNSDLLKTQFFTINDFVKKIVIEKYFEEINIHTHVERLLFFLELLKSENNIDDDLKAFYWAKKLSGIFDEIDKQQSGDKLENFKYTETTKPARLILENLKSLYNKYRERYKNYCFNGKIFELASKINDFSEFSNFKIIFAGLIYLSKSEEILIEKLSNFSEVYFLVQTDFHKRDSIEKNNKYFNFETFKVLDRIKLKGKIIEEKGENLKPEIHFIECANINSEGEFIAKKINKLNLENYAVILPEAKTLFPLLSYVDENLPVNITMGYPLKDTNLGIFLEILFKVIIELYLNKRVKSSNFLKLINNPIFEYLDFSKNEIKNIKEKILKNRFTYFEIEENLEVTKFLINFLKNDLQEAFLYFFKRLKKEKIDNFTLQILTFFFKEIVENLELIKKFKNDIFFYYAFLNELLKDLNIPFEGHPLKGIQIMGMLEARMLTFDTIIISDVNEGIMPSGDKIDPLMPEEIKRSIGLTSYKEKEELMKYNFFRLVYSSKKAYLLYITGSSLMEKTSRSRFIEQLILQKEIENKEKVDIEKIPFYFPEFKKEKLEIEKSIEFINFIRNKKNFSATEIDEYITCPYMFYLKRFKKIEKPISLEEEYEYDKVGNFIHKIFENSFKGYTGQIISKEKFKKISNKILDSIKDIYNDNNFKNFSEFHLKSLEIILETRLKNYFAFILDNFINFKLLALEKEFYNQKLKIKGKVDRLDLVEDILRIVDYKTGTRIQLPAKSKIEDLVENENYQIFNDKILKKIKKVIKSFQMPIYAILVKDKFKNSKIINEMHILSKNKTSETIKIFHPESLNHYQFLLEYVISHIEKSDYIFAIPDLHCKYCDFNYFCKFSL